MKVYDELEAQLHALLTPALLVYDSQLHVLASQAPGKVLMPTARRLDGAQCRSGAMQEKIFCMPPRN